mmetsp:Transcript_172/g.444  ORF Transcript_172/g.444 Transcript_172/m.444 type:complete len:116 (+) Transcript_172:1993-2340(+)
MHLCDIPEEAMNQLHLPNGLPLVSSMFVLNLSPRAVPRRAKFNHAHIVLLQVYNVKRKCITLLDDGSGRDPMEVHDFGPAAQHLFRPCELDDDFFLQMEEQISKADTEEKPVLAA